MRQDPLPHIYITPSGDGLAQAEGPCIIERGHWVFPPMRTLRCSKRVDQTRASVTRENGENQNLSIQTP